MSRTMPYLIDGHNLIGQLPDISLADPNDEAKLVQKLMGFTARTQRRCVVVFDAGITGGRSRMSTRMVEVVFAPRGTSADHIMLQRIADARDTQYWVVVSSDREVLSAARRRRMRAVRSTDFVGMMRPQLAHDKDDDDHTERYPSPAEVDAWLKIFTGRE
ncbi:MAG: NYN domain-containing protein [Chloroflexi bacterium]|nr:NYN domain-containing protein [Chloroflexota bacterium]